jgi:hypothetical protein
MGASVSQAALHAWFSQKPKNAKKLQCIDLGHGSIFALCATDRLVRRKKAQIQTQAQA